MLPQMHTIFPHATWRIATTGLLLSHFPYKHNFLRWLELLCRILTGIGKKIYWFLGMISPGGCSFAAWMLPLHCEQRRWQGKFSGPANYQNWSCFNGDVRDVNFISSGKKKFIIPTSNNSLISVINRNHSELQVIFTPIKDNI